MWYPGGGGGRRPLDQSAPPTLASSTLLDNAAFLAAFGGAQHTAGRRRSTESLVGRLLGGRGSGRRSVTCIACGRTVERKDAREYDRLGDRWDRENKTFEYLCKPCHGDLDHQPRDELEGLLVEIDAGERERDEFLEWYCALVEERYGPLEDEG